MRHVELGRLRDWRSFDALISVSYKTGLLIAMWVLLADRNSTFRDWFDASVNLNLSYFCRMNNIEQMYVRCVFW